MDEFSLSNTSTFQKDVRDIKRAISVESSCRGTCVYVVSISNDYNKNKILFIPCYGSPITREVYDSVRDGFVIYASDFFDLGKIPVSYKIEIEGSEWMAEIPLPMSTIKRYLTDEQKAKFSLWRSKFNKDDYRFSTAQMTEVY